MNDHRPHSALREWRAHISQPGVLAALGGIGCVLGLAGPFGTDTLLPFVPRLVYWIGLSALTYSIGMLTGAVLWPRLSRLPRAGAVALVGLATGQGISLAVLAVNLAVFSYLPDWSELPAFVGTVTAVALIVTVLLQLLDGHLAQAAPVPEAPPPLLDRLPLDKRGPLVALSVEDHYVRVRTTRGEEMLLMRLSDAIRETAPLPGAQVHRSHWVAFGQVTAARRDGDRGILTMAIGPEIPVSRANLSKIREAGLLPR